MFGNRETKGRGGRMLRRRVWLVSIVVCLGAMGCGKSKEDADAPATGMTMKDGPVIDGGSFVVNLKDFPRVAKVSYGILMADGVDPAKAKERLPIVKDQLMPFLMDKTSKELASADGFEMVRDRLTKDAQSIYMGRAIRGLITELIVE